MVDTLLLLAAVAGGVVASVAGFGIGSLVTPVLAWQLGALLQERATTPALLGVDLPKHAFATTATAVALMVDAARVPVYLWFMGDEIRQLGAPIAIATTGVVIGTLAGLHVLDRIPERSFRREVAVVLSLLGIAMLLHGLVG